MRRWYLGALCAALMVFCTCGSLFEQFASDSEDVNEVSHVTPGLPTALDATSEDHTGHDGALSSVSDLTSTTTQRKRGLRSSPDFKQARARGRKILEAFDDGDSPFQRVSDLRDWGWSPADLSQEVVRDILGQYVGVLKAKGISVESPTLHGVQWTHDRETVHDGVKYLVWCRERSRAYEETNHDRQPAAPTP